MAEENDQRPADRRSSLAGMAAQLGRLPAEKRRAAIETSAALAGISLRASRAFVEAVPKAAKVLSAENMRSWGEIGRRIAMGSADAGVAFFVEGLEDLTAVPKNARGYVFQIVNRQLILSSSIALETLRSMGKLASHVGDDELFSDILKLTVEIAGRSAKHSADFLKHTSSVADSLNTFADDKKDVAKAFLELGSQFAIRTGGMTADLWAGIPTALKGLSAKNASELAESGSKFLEFGGSVTLHFISSGAEVLRSAAETFDEWRTVVRKVAGHGNAVLIAFLRATPKFFSRITTAVKGPNPRTDETERIIRSVLSLVGEIADADAESALAAFRSSTDALRRVSLEQFQEWIEIGLREKYTESAKARRSYFALETRESNESLRNTRTGLQLEQIQTVLRIYVEGLTGREVEISPLTAIPQESRIGDGKTIYLPSVISEFDDESMDFRLFKVLAAHGAGQIEFGTFETDTDGLRAAYANLREFYSATQEQFDAFSVAGHLNQTTIAETDDDLRTSAGTPEKLPRNSDYRAVLQVFPEPRLARKVFGTMENARMDSRLRQTYRGLRKDLDLMQTFLKRSRPYIFDIPMHQVPFELLFQITLCGGATDDARQFYGQIVSEIEGVIDNYLKLENATVADSLMAASRVYNLFQNISTEDTQQQETDETDQEKKYSFEKNAAESAADDVSREEKPKSAQDLRDLFSAWNSLDEDGEPDDISGAETWSSREVPEQALEAGDKAFSYDEWDRELNDYRVGWSRVVEKRVKQGDRNFVELARSRYRGVISSIRYQFQLMKPENLTRVNREIDGEDYDLNALVDLVIDRRADGRQSENIYTKRLRKQRDVAVSLLLDQSSSTARTITRNPLQPYTYPGRRIIEIEKEGLVLMSEALEAVGDVYSIYGFTSEGRHNVKFHVVKDFAEKYSDDIEKRIGGITFQNNTRLGAAIRHAAHKLLRQENRTKLLIILTDGRPYDHDYGDARYAREDVREALIEAKTSGITPFCITIDRESESELKDLYGDVGYTIIDDVLSLPERMPNIYRRLTS